MSEVPTIISREEARAKGLMRYFTGKPCKNGHIAERHVNSWNCLECIRARIRAWKAANPEIARERKRKQASASYAANRERWLKRSRAWNAANLERKRKQARVRYAANRERLLKQEVARRASMDSFKKRAQRVNALARERGAAGVVAHEDIRAKYFARADTNGVPRCGNGYLPCNNNLRHGYHVDHIDAIDRGGQNVPENIQCLCPSCNTMKGTKIEEEFKALIERDRPRLLAERAQKRQQLLHVLVDEFGVKPKPRRKPLPAAQLDLFQAA